ncbi:hypothetical protein CEY12_05305 [Chryseobacterium sp. T16E-39]|uniref:hypothetical protein n=1 Tax=Chryseobacterium sp. T16E-39 TaxID=2015076 RepID=UPI000B5B44CF|nr:hypothetical protein [Chryseobacterium sp. T16E-39]ASK29557.1 hypothetical protein CEY12_05305 [Chryseobacterium sp. T16E-39]
MPKKISKSQIVFFSILIILFSIYSFILKPIIKERYLHSDLKNFEDGSWKYTIITFSILLIIMFFAIIKSKTKDLSNLPVGILVLGLVCFAGLHHPVNYVLLFVNIKTGKEKIVRKYEIVNHKEQSVFWLDANENSIHDNSDLDRINKCRAEKNLKSVFEMKNKDNIIIRFKKGIMDINYLY